MSGVSQERCVAEGFCGTLSCHYVRQLGVRNMLKRMRAVFWILLAILMIYTGISVYFMEHFFLGTTVNGEDAEFLNTKQVSEQVMRQSEGYQLTLKAQNGQERVLTAEELGVSFYQNDVVKQVKRRQNGFLWPRMFWQRDFYQIVPGIQFEEERLSECIRKLEWLQQGEDPEDAWIEMTGEGYRVHAEKQGSRIDEVRLLEQIKGAVSNLQPELDLLKQGCYRMPAVTADSEEITGLRTKLDHWLSAQVTYEFGPETEVADKRAISGFVNIEGYEASLNPQAVADWVAQLAGKRDTCGRQRNFKSTLRGTIPVKGGSYGWQIDQASESAALLEHVEQGAQVTKEPAYLQRGNAWSENYDIGTTYIEIDITAQHMWFYKEGKLVVETDVVTGNMSRGYNTPEMVASVKYKARNAVLRGQGYASPVKYWMPFYGNYGIHDASWRKDFGGDIYLTAGSHGCVNTPRDAMKVLFENVEKGTPVVLYY